jgi:sigma-B regulation protein RsbU (phosphoserine phosphatase)
MHDTIDLLPCGYVSFTDNGLIRRVNFTLSSWLGYSKEELEGKGIERIFTLASRIFYNTHFFPLIKLQPQVSEIFLSLRDNKNGDVPVLTNAKRIPAEEGSLIHCVFIRVEERKKYEQEILEAKREAESALKENKQLSEVTKSLEKQTLELEKHYQHQMMMNENLVQFSKIVSHDLQEPIHKIQVFSDQIANDTKSHLSPKSKTLFNKINAASTRLKTLTSGLQEYITIDDDKHLVAVDLNTTIKTAMSRAVNEMQFADFDVEVDKMPVIEGFEKQLELLFFHLIENAIQFREPSRKLTMRVAQVILTENIFRVSKDQYRYTDHVRITFQDNGKGFPDEYDEYVFKLLKKFHSSAGAGIGLSLVKKIVQNHSGMVRVKSTPQSGTQFELELPLKAFGNPQ